MKLIIVGSAVILFASRVEGQTSRDIRVVSENSNSAVIEFIPQIKAGGEVPQFYGNIHESSGNELVPVREIPLRFATKRASVRVVAKELLEERTFVMRKKKLTDRSSDAAVFNARSEKIEKPIAEVRSFSTDWNGYSGVLVLRPAAWQNERVRMYRRMVVEISFDPWLDGKPRIAENLRGEFQSPATSATNRSVVANSPFAQGDWYKLEVSETGIYKLDQSFLQANNISIAGAGGIQSIRLFGNGGEAIPENLNVGRPDDIQEIPRLVIDKNGNGALDPEDAVLFYGKGPRGWKYVPSTKSFSHYIHAYGEKNFYFLTLSGGNGLSMDSVGSLSTPTSFQPTDFPEKKFLEQELFNLISSGRRWFGKQFDAADFTGVFMTSLPGYVLEKPISYRVALANRSSTVDTFRVYERDVLLGNPVLMGTVNTNSSDDNFAFESPVKAFSRTAALPSSQSVLKFVYGMVNSAAKGWLDWFEISYRRQFTAENGALLFTTPDTNAVTEFTVTDLAVEDVFAFDVTTHGAVKRIAGMQVPAGNGTSRRFRLQSTAGAVREVAITTLSAAMRPSGARKISNQNLHGAAGPVDFVIISPPEFLSEAQRLQAYRQQRDSLRTKIFNVEEIYNEFSGGMQDPMAIRDFLKYAQTNWATQRQYVLLFGGGHYDYKNILTSERNWIVPYETDESINQLVSYTSDDYFVFLNPLDQRTTMSLGRIPAKSVAEAKTCVDKIIRYEHEAPFDTWRNRITFVADDGLTSTSNDYDIHTSQADNLARLYTPNSIEKRKIYLIEYPTVNSAGGRRKPDVNEAIVEAVNKGTLLLNYTGHGNTRLWAHEAVFTREGDIPRLTNRNKLTFLVGATCNFAQYDNPSEESAGEIMLTMDQGGAIAEITASRSVFSQDNADLNYTFYSYLFQRDNGGKIRRLGDAMWLTKQIHADGSLHNDLKFHLLGDPTLRLLIPLDSARIDTLNGKTTATLTMLKSLGRGTLRGTIRKNDGSLWSSFNGKGLLEVFDANKTVRVAEWGFSFTKIGSVLHRGEVSVTDGNFQASFRIPKDVSYSGNARISFYASDNLLGTDAVGFTENVFINGVDSSQAADNEGPLMRLFFDDTTFAFRSGDVLRQEATMIANLSDASGINTSSVGIGHGLEFTLTNPDQTINLSDYYKGDLDTYQRGSIQYRLPRLAVGSHTLRIKAWDTYNNSSQMEVDVDIRNAGQDELVEPVNFPNPFSSETAFTFQRSSTDPLDVEIRIYSVAGRLLRVLAQSALTGRFIQVPWNGTDEQGDRLANGVYLYKIVSRSLGSTESHESMGKLAIIR